MTARTANGGFQLGWFSSAWQNSVTKATAKLEKNRKILCRWIILLTIVLYSYFE